MYGADGQPGKAGVDDDDENGVDDPGELGWGDSDDYYPVMNGHRNASATPPRGCELVPDHPTIVDLLKYRIQYERCEHRTAELSAGRATQPGRRSTCCRRKSSPASGWTSTARSATAATMPATATTTTPMAWSMSQASRAIRSTNANGIVDEPEEAGEPFVDHDPTTRSAYGQRTLRRRRGLLRPGRRRRNIRRPRDQLWQGLVERADRLRLQPRRRRDRRPA